MALQIVIDQIEVHPNDGSITVRFKKQIVDGESIIDIGYHRSGVLQPGDNTDEYITHLNKHFQEGIREGEQLLKFPPVDGSELKAIATLVHTTERINKRKNKNDSIPKT